MNGEQTAWLTEIGEAADELGYGIALLEPSRIELLPMDTNSMEITIQTVFLSGATLRRLLRPVRKADSVELVEVPA